MLPSPTRTSRARSTASAPRPSPTRSRRVTVAQRTRRVPGARAAVLSTARTRRAGLERGIMRRQRPRSHDGRQFERACLEPRRARVRRTLGTFTAAATSPRLMPAARRASRATATVCSLLRSTSTCAARCAQVARGWFACEHRRPAREQDCACQLAVPRPQPRIHCSALCRCLLRAQHLVIVRARAAAP